MDSKKIFSLVVLSILLLYAFGFMVQARAMEPGVAKSSIGCGESIRAEKSTAKLVSNKTRTSRKQ